MLPGERHRVLTTMRTLFTLLNWEYRREQGLMVLRVKPTPIRSPTNSLNIPMDSTPLNSLPSVCCLRGMVLLLLRHSANILNAQKERLAASS